MRRISRQIGKWLSFTTASWITISGGVLALVGIPLFAVGYDWAAVALLTLSFLTDWWDGCVARYHQGNLPGISWREELSLTVWQRLNYKGVTHLGRSIDPFVDKLRFLGLLLVLGPGYIPLWCIIVMTTTAVLLSLVRPIKRALKLPEAGANRFGKWKVYAEVICMVILVFTTRPLFGVRNELYKLPYLRASLALCLGLAILLGLLSLLQHIRSGWAHARVQQRAVS